jgi:myxalamid-type polyketide synthase MxaB
VPSTHAELRASALRVLGGLAEAGVRPGDIVLLELGTAAELLASLWACLLGGLVAAPRPPGHGGAEESASLTPPGIPGRRTWTVRSAAEDPRGNVLSFATLRGSTPAGDPIPGRDDEAALVLATSGTTGSARWIALSHENALTSIAGSVELNGYTPDEVSLNWLPLHHVGGLLRTIREVGLGCLQVQLPGELVAGDPLAWLDAIERHRATMTWAPNFAFVRLLAALRTRAPDRGPWCLDSMRSWHSSGEPIHGPTVRALAEELAHHGLSPDALHTAWGMTEACFATCSRTLLSDLDEAPTRPVSSGPPIPGIELRVVDSEGEEVPEGEVGQVQVRGPGVGRVLGAPPPASGAWRDTGDLGMLVSGRLTITGRARDLLLVRGRKLSPRSIEEIAEEVVGVAPGTAVAASVEDPAVPSPRVALFLALAPSFSGDVEAVVLECRERVGQGLGITLRWVLPVSPEDLPRGAVGKVQRRALVERWRDGALPVPTSWPFDIQGAAPAPIAPGEGVAGEVATLLGQALGGAPLAPDRSFFAAGGDSLAVLEATRLLREHFPSCRLSPADLYRAPTPAALATRVTGSGPSRTRRRRGASVASGAVAVVGMACRFPGAPDVESFWESLETGTEALSHFTEAELAASGISPEWTKNPRYVPAGMILGDIEGFDAEFFGLSDGEAAMLDPQQRLLLECAWEALEDAGYPAGTGGQRVGVYAGARLSEYLHGRQPPVELFGHDPEPPALHFQRLLANDKDYVATRLAYLLDLRGPAVSVQTACSTSLVAVHLACGSLLTGECDLALAGGASVRVPQRAGYLCSEGMIYSPDGHTRTFDARAAGTVFGSGAGMVALRRLEDAQADGDHVLAVIRGTAVNNDGGGDKASYSAPSPRGQAEVIAAALADADLRPEDLSYLEAHGTATPLGDAIEVAALAEVFRDSGLPPGACALGTVKSNLGHLVQAAGVAGLIKTVLMLQRRRLVPNPTFERLNPELGLERTPFAICEESRPWEAGARPLRAGIGSYGFGGTNAYAVLEEAPEEERSAPPAPPYLLTLSARTPRALEELGERTAAALSGRSDGELADACFTSRVGRRHFGLRRAVVASTAEELRSRLVEWSGGIPPTTSGNSPPKLAFAFTGQGAALAGSGRVLLDREPVFRASLERSDALLREELEYSLLDVLHGDDAAELLTDTALAQPATVALHMALVDLWRARGLEPTLVVGHSLGEVSAAWAAGVLTRDEALRFAAARGRSMGEGCPPGVMLATAAPPELLDGLVAAAPGELALAAINGDRRAVLAGSEAACANAAEELSRRGSSSRRLPVTRAFHSPLVDPSLDEILRAAGEFPPRRPEIAFVSTCTGTIWPSDQPVPAEHWPRQAREPVRFSQALACLAEQEIDVVVEVGPEPVLSVLAAGAPSGPWLPSLRPGVDEGEQMLRSLASAWERGVDPDWSALGGTGRRASLPTYPFQRRRHWVEPRRPVHPEMDVSLPGAHPLLGGRVLSPPPRVLFRSRLSAASEPFLRDHGIYDGLPMLGTGFLEIALAAAAAVYGEAEPCTVEGLAIASPLLLELDRPHQLHVELEPDDSSGYRFRLCARRDGEERWVDHAGARLAPGAPPPPKRLDLDEVRARCPAVVSPEDVHVEKRRRGADLGPSLHMVREIQRGEGELLALAELPEEVRADAGRYQAHPVLTDACMQLASLAATRVEGADELFLPTVIESLRWYRPLPSRVLCHLRVAGGDGREIYTLDFEVADEAGEVLVAARGVCFKRARRDAMAQSSGPGVDPGLVGELAWESADGSPPAGSGAPVGRWWLLGGGELATRLAARLEADGARVDVFPDALDLSALRRAAEEATADDGDGPPLVGAVYLAATDLPADDGDAALADPGRAGRLCARALELVQVLAEVRDRAPRAPWAGLWLVTRGAQATGHEAGPLHPSAATLWGLGRVIQREESGLACRLVDLDPSGTDPDAELLATRLLAGQVGDLRALRGGRDLRPRIRAARSLETSHGDRAVASLPPPRAVTSGPAPSIDGLALTGCGRREPGPGEVEIRVLASGLNFRDALNASGRLRGPLGWECSGIVTAVGTGVDGMAPGDEVMALAPWSMRELVTVDARQVVPKPSRLSFAAAAAQPMTYITSLYALQHLAGLRAGQRVLIHAAAGGIGHAAVAVARRLGAEVLATASRPKWNYLRSLGVRHIADSRVPGFSVPFLDEPGGAPVDVVLNTLAGPFVEESLRMLAPGGHFIELGHPDMDVWTPERLLQARPDIHAHQFRLLEDVLPAEPELLAGLFQDLAEDLESGALPPLPVRVHPAEECRSALRELLGGSHVGKYALAWSQGPAQGLRLRADATYLISGGTGALGRLVARHLVEAGARHLALLSRRPVDVGDLHPGVEGVEVRLLSADVSRPEDLEAALTEIRETMPPLCGVVHAAGILEDAVLRRQDPGRLQRVMAPKVAGAFHLDRLTRDLPLDFFLLFSSLAALSGNPGQANYAAANAYLDALAHLRRARGLPGTSVNWGPWDEVGMAARGEDEHQGRRERAGVRPLDPEQALDALSRILGAECAQVTVAELDWSRLPYGAAPSKARAARAPRPRSRPATWTRQAVLELVRDAVGRQAGLDSQEVSEEATLRDLGLDSLAVLSLREVIVAGLDHAAPAPVATFLESPEVGRLVDLLHAELMEVAEPADVEPVDGAPNDEVPTEEVPTAAAPPEDPSPAPAPPSDEGAMPSAARLRRRLEEVTKGWRRPWDSHEGLLFRYTEAEEGTPLFWCSQGENELRALADALPDRPLWGMRSGHLIAPTSAPDLRVMADLYTEEVVELSRGSPVVIGGNCQGSVVAFLVAQKLWARGHAVQRLCMLENRVPTVFQDIYPGRVELLFGAESDHVYDPFKRFLMPQRGWRRLFPGGFELTRLPGAHGYFFVPPALDHLVERLALVLATADRELADQACLDVLWGDGLELSAAAHARESGAPGDPVRVEVTLNNRTDEVWRCPPSAGVIVAGHWLDGDGEVISWADGAQTVDLTVPARGEGRLLLELELPGGAAAQTLRVGIAEDGLDWVRFTDLRWRDP